MMMLTSNSERVFQHGRHNRVFPSTSPNDLYFKSLSDLITYNSPTKINENIMQQNRILINYKKLRHFETSFLRNKNALKKNFDLIFSQMKSSAVDSKNQKKNDLLTPFLLVHEKKGVKKPLKLSKSADRLDIQTKQRSKKNVSKFLNKNKFETNVKSESQVTGNVNSRNKLISTALSKKNKILFDTYESLNRNFIEFDSLNSPDKFAIFPSNESIGNFSWNKHNFILKNICFHYPDLVEKNFIFRQHIDFSKSMIEFTLCLHKIIAHIEKVRNIQ